MTPTIDLGLTRTPRQDPSPTRTAAPTILVVATGGRDGATLRLTPGGDRLAGLPDGTRVSPLGEEQQVAGRRWLRVQDVSNRVGWVAAELLVAPTATPRDATVTVTPTRTPTATATSVAGGR